MNGFIKISHYAGMREDLVQASGGNSSFKDGNKMYIKASGYHLCDVTEDDGYAVVDYQRIYNFFNNNQNIKDITDSEGRVALEKAYISGKRPSIETYMHSVPMKYVLHTHPVVVNVLTCRKDSKEIINKLFPEACYIPYSTPGVELAKEFFECYSHNQDSLVYFLENHGLMVCGENADFVINKTEEIINYIEMFLKINNSGYHIQTILWNYFPEKCIFKTNNINLINNFRKGIWNHTFCPDCVVFIGKKILELFEGDISFQINKFTKMYGEPSVIVYKNDLYIVAKDYKKACYIQSVLSFSGEVMNYNDDVECRFLTEDEQNFLLNWESEKYRKNI